MARVRARGVWALYDPESEAYIVPKPLEYFDTTDSLVKAHPWAFGTDDELADPIESTTAAPGEKRTTRRAK